MATERKQPPWMRPISDFDLHLEAPIGYLPGVLGRFRHQLLQYNLKAQMPTIYFLFEGKEVIYVGQSVNPVSRIDHHRLRIPFDGVVLLPAGTVSPYRLEKSFISMLKPRLNIRERYADPDLDAIETLWKDPV